MIQNYVKINNKTGIHAIPATMITKVAREFEARISMFKSTDYCNACVSTDILSMNLVHGDELLLVAEGYDELQAIEEMKKLIESDFGI
ncbi:HPr family phosphocarrier protein [Clostridium ganghwense]|uniref:HPr family phosphocarrier protein n=1 Tax=Clostridium ganghwense TaxID=312089 RepID=A0ABT4CTD4_9CLOT|nr:HPr family phosphocarrier protein [Clostridium ganghwense]MCY6371456.1 HPr family phosphocarrier protein [Clostridium ganghwense]